VHEFLTWVQASALGQFMRESSAWTYALVNLAHILGIATLFGAVVILDFRLMGVWHRTPLHAIADATAPVAAVGFAVAAASGVGLLSANATDYVGNPLLLVKFPAIGIGLVNALAIQRSSIWRASRTRELSRRETRHLALLGGTSLTCWFIAISAGRMIGYW
jgi:hypothetical protein